MISAKWLKTIDNKYNHLLVTEALIVILLPLLHTLEARFPIIPLLLLVALAPALNVVLPQRAFLILMALGVITLALNILISYQAVEFKRAASLCLLILYSVFVLLAIIILLKRISSMKVVTADTVKGGISVYILIGILWTMLYLMVANINPDSYANLRDKELDCFYYSFTTLTTLGYGDIVPTTPYTKILAVLEAIVGPVYLAIFIAQLVGLRIVQKLDSKE